jgi:hypothetical protein
VLAAALLIGCAKSAVSVQPPYPTPVVAEHCSHLSNLLPERLESLRPRVISPRSPLVHAWGDPAIVLTCGVAVPAGFSAGSAATTVVNGVQWFQQPGPKAVVWTALRPGVDVRLLVPTSYQDQGSFLVDLAGPLKAALPRPVSGTPTSAQR